MVVHVDANGPGQDLRNPLIKPMIKPIARSIQPCRTEQHRTACACRGRQEFSSRKTGVTTFRHTTHSRSIAIVESGRKVFTLTRRDPVRDRCREFIRWTN